MPQASGLALFGPESLVPEYDIPGRLVLLIADLTLVPDAPQILELTDQALGLARTRVSQDAIREFRVVTARFDPEIGGSPGGARPPGPE